MSKSVNALSVVPMVHTPKGSSCEVAYLQMMAGDKKAGSYIRTDYIRYLIDNVEVVRAAIAKAESMLVVVAPVAKVAPAPAPVVAPAGDASAALIAQLMAQMAAMQAALGIAPAPVAAPVAIAAPAAVAKPSPLSDRAAKVRAAANR